MGFHYPEIKLSHLTKLLDIKWHEQNCKDLQKTQIHIQQLAVPFTRRQTELYEVHMSIIFDRFTPFAFLGGSFLQQCLVS